MYIPYYNNIIALFLNIFTLEFIGFVDFKHLLLAWVFISFEHV